MLPVITMLEIKEEHVKLYNDITEEIVNKASISSVTFAIDEKNPGQDAYSSNGGGVTTQYEADFSNDGVYQIFMLLSSCQQYLDTIRHFLVSGFITPDQYNQRKSNSLQVTSTIANNMLKIM